MDFVKNYVKSVWRYFVGFAFLFIYLEIALRLVIDGAIKGNNLFFLFFVPSLSFFFSIFCSFQTNHTLKNSSDYKIANKIVFCFLSFLITLYFLIQLVYFRVFGSLFSFSFVKMGGEAAGNFSGATLLYIKKSFWQILAMLLPLLSFIVLACLDEKFLSGKVFGSGKKSEDSAIWQKCIFHGITLVLCVVFWFLAVFSIRCFGNQRGSAFYTYKSSSTDTDTSAERLGAFTTSVIEGRIYFFGNTE